MKNIILILLTSIPFTSYTQITFERLYPNLITCSDIIESNNSSYFVLCRDSIIKISDNGYIISQKHGGNGL